MAAKIYCWRNDQGSWGHMSLQLSDGTYISHWPKEIKSKTNPFPVIAKQMRNYAYDITAEGRDADEVIDLSHAMVDEAKLRNYWKEYKSTAKYHAIGNNCAQVIVHCLEVGMEEDSKSLTAWQMGKKEVYRKRMRFYTMMGDSLPDIDDPRTPEGVLELIKYWKEAFDTGHIGQSDNDNKCTII